MAVSRLKSKTHRAIQDSSTIGLSNLNQGFARKSIFQQLMETKSRTLLRWSSKDTVLRQFAAISYSV